MSSKKETFHYCHFNCPLIHYRPLSSSKSISVTEPQNLTQSLPSFTVCTRIMAINFAIRHNYRAVLSIQWLGWRGVAYCETPPSPAMLFCSLPFPVKTHWFGQQPELFVTSMSISMVYLDIEGASSTFLFASLDVGVGGLRRGGT